MTKVRGGDKGSEKLIEKNTAATDHIKTVSLAGYKTAVCEC